MVAPQLPINIVIAALSRVALRGRFLQRHPEVASALVVGATEFRRSSAQDGLRSDRVRVVVSRLLCFRDEGNDTVPLGSGRTSGRAPDRINLWAASSAG